MFLLKIHSSDKGTVVAICDAELLGKVFESGNFCVSVEECFFGGRAASFEEICGALKHCATANIVGNRVISELASSGRIKESGVMEIRGVKYAMVFKV